MKPAICERCGMFKRDVQPFAGWQLCRACVGLSLLLGHRLGKHVDGDGNRESVRGCPLCRVD